MSLLSHLPRLLSLLVVANANLRAKCSSWGLVQVALAMAVLSLTMGTLPAAAQTPITGATRVAVGESHTCALTSAGGVKCWGSNSSGQLGDNSTTQRLTAVDVSGLTSGVTAIAAGIVHTCALTSTGGVKCWGSNFLGQLGHNSTTERLTAVDVSGLTSGVTAIAAGSFHTCALTSIGGVKCWGWNGNGQLGDNSTTHRLTAVDVSGLTSGVTAIAAGASHTCALTSTGGVKCWGYNGYGQLGDNSITDHWTAVDVSGLTSGVAAIATGGGHSCALTSTGGVKCWGDNSSGQLGDNSTSPSLTAVDVSGLSSGVTAIATGLYHSCALTGTGGVKCWGNNVYGQLGDISTSPRLTAVEVSGLSSGVTAFATGYQHTCALTSTGGVKCWGDNRSGQLGDNSTTHRLTAVDVSGLTSGVTAVAAGGIHSCALTSTGGVKCWGWNAYGELGDNSITDRLTAVDVDGLTSGATAIAIGYQHSCALTSNGGVKCWGENGSGQLGDNSQRLRLTAVDVNGLTSGVTAIAAGGSHTCALTSNGGVKCWGHNVYGQLGDNSQVDRLTPVDVSGLTSGVAVVAAGTNHTCALTNTGGVKCWGGNGLGQLGDNSQADRLTAVDVSGLSSGVTAIATASGHTCALTSIGGVKCWGWNGNGQLGDNSQADRLTAVDVSGLTSGVTAIAAGEAHTCALTSTGGIKCWGYNLFGQLGDNSTTQRLTAVDVSGLTSGATAVATSASHTCALTSTGGAKCWGYNSRGQLGDGTVDGASPFPVVSLELVPTKSSQTITFGPAPRVPVGGTGTVSATATSGLAVTFSVTPNNGKCTLSGSTVTGIAAGLCVVYADQAGDATYAPAPQASMSFAIIPVPLSPPSEPTNVSVAAGPGRVTLTFSPPVSTGGALIVGYTATCSASGQTSGGATRSATGTGSPLVVYGLTAGVTYACSVTAYNGTYTSAASVALPVTPGVSFDITPILMFLVLEE